MGLVQDCRLGREQFRYSQSRPAPVELSREGRLNIAASYSEMPVSYFCTTESADALMGECTGKTKEKPRAKADNRMMKDKREKNACAGDYSLPRLLDAVT